MVAPGGFGRSRLVTYIDLQNLQDLAVKPLVHCFLTLGFKHSRSNGLSVRARLENRFFSQISFMFAVFVDILETTIFSLFFVFIFKRAW
jgi:hypothetical protein